MLRVAFVLPVLLAAALAGGSASSANAPLVFAGRSASGTTPQVSSNWAGYAAVAPEGASLSFANVTGTWVVPKVTCSDRADAVAFWVGLGGYTDTAPALEQLGTAAECDGISTTPTYYAWWEIVPAASVPITLKVRPGDTITAAVAVKDQTVVMSLRNVTRRTRFSKTQTVSQTLDVTSAEWIAEAPATCNSANRCRVIPLSNFRGVTFTKIAATGNDLPGTLAGPQGQPSPWVATPITLVTGGSGDGFLDPVAPFGSAEGAVPGPVSADGRSFAVAWRQNVAPPSG